MPPRGRPRQYPDDHTRWRTHAARRRGQQPNGSIPIDPYPYFLFYDPRAISEVPLADSPPGTILDTVHEALDALSPLRETDRDYPSISPFEQTADLAGQDDNLLSLDHGQGDICGSLSSI